MLKVKWKLSVSISIIVILWSVFQWYLMDWLAPFLYFPIAIIFWLMFLIVFFINIFQYKKFKIIGYKIFAPLLVQLFTLLMVVYTPFATIWLNMNFKLHKSQREHVVEDVISGKLVPNVKHNSSLISLGNEYPTLSMGGNEIVIEEHEGLKYVFFFTYRGILDGYAGFIYVPSGGNPIEYSDLNESKRVEIEHLEGNWYYASHH